MNLTGGFVFGGIYIWSKKPLIFWAEKHRYKTKFSSAAPKYQEYVDFVSKLYRGGAILRELYLAVH